MAVKFFYENNDYYDSGDMSTAASSSLSTTSDDNLSMATQGIENILQQITLINPSFLSNKYVLHELIRLYAKIDIEKAKQLFQRAYYTTQQQQGDKEHQELNNQGILKDTFLVLATQYIQNGDINDAKEILSCLKHNEYIAASLWNRIKYMERGYHHNGKK